MPTAGASISPNTTTSASRSGTNAAFLSSLTLGESGTLSSFSVFVDQNFSNPNYRVAVYAGGTSDSDPNGATKVWESSVQTAPADPAWVTITADNSALSAGRLWLLIAIDSATFCFSTTENSTADTDFNLGLRSFSSGFDPESALLSPLASGVATTNASQVLKAYITYATGGGDVTAPILTSPTGTATGTTTATVGATTDEANGTQYAVASTSITQPTDVQVEAGQDHTGASVPSSSRSITATGANTQSITGLTASTSYYAHVMHKDAAGNRSNVVTSAQFTTDSVVHTTTGALAAQSATIAGTAAHIVEIVTEPLKNNTGTVLASETGIEVCVYNQSTGVLVVKLTGQSTDASGVMTLTDNALVTGTAYWLVIKLSSGALGFTAEST